MWPDRRFADLVGLEHPIVQAPMAGVATVELAAEVSLAGGLGSLGCAMLDPERVAETIRAFRERADRPVNVNFFCHRPPVSVEDAAWRARLSPYYDEERLGSPEPHSDLGPPPFGDAVCAVVEDHDVMSTILVIGGTGKVGRRLTLLLREAGHTVRVASRTHGDTRFDWHEPATHRPALEGADGVFIVGPGSATGVASRRPSL